MALKLICLFVLLASLSFKAQIPVEKLTIRKYCCDTASIKLKAIGDKDTIGYSELDREIPLSVSLNL